MPVTGQTYGFRGYSRDSLLPTRGLQLRPAGRPAAPVQNFAGRPLRVLMIPPICWTPERQEAVSADRPDPNLLDIHLASHGIVVDLLDPHASILNPFHGRGTLLQALDPWRALRILFAKRRYDLVVSVFESGAVPLLLLKKLALFKTPIALWDVGLTEDWRLRERFLDYVLPRVKAVMVLSAKQAGYIRERWRPEGAVLNILHYVDADFFRPTGSESEGSYIFSIGNDHGRDYPTLLEALRGINMPVKIRTNQLTEADLPEGSPIELVGQRLGFTELRQSYADARIVVIPLKETLNASGVSSILEAAAMGKPMIVSGNTAIADFVRAGETCLQVPCGDAPALNRAIKTLLDDKELRARLGRNARNMVEQHFSTEAFAKLFASSMRAALA